MNNQGKENLVILPSKEKILKNLIAVEDSTFAKEKLYPIIAERAESELLPQGVVLMIALAISDACIGMPVAVENLMFMLMPKYIGALISDEKALSEAIEFYKPL